MNSPWMGGYAIGKGISGGGSEMGGMYIGLVNAMGS